MAMIHINRSGTSLGVFSEDDVREGLRSGRFMGSDLAWREGMPSWLPLSQFSEFAAAAAPAAPAPASAPPPPPPPFSAPGSLAGAASVEPRSGLPWDARKTLGFFGALFQTIRMVLMEPNKAFTAMKREGGLGEPLIYAVAGGAPGLIAAYIYQTAFGALSGPHDHSALSGLVGFMVVVVLIVIFAPIFLALGMFVGGGILHVCLMIVGGAKQSFETTFRVLCFTVGSTYPIMIVPFCGGMIAGIWGLVLECIGLSRAHEIDTWRAVVAVLLPLIVCCGLGLIFVILLGSVFHSSLSHVFGGL